MKQFYLNVNALNAVLRNLIKIKNYVLRQHLIYSVFTFLFISLQINAQTNFASLGAVDSGGLGFRTISSNPNIVVTNVMVNDGTQMYHGAAAGQSGYSIGAFTIKANGIQDFTFIDLKIEVTEGLEIYSGSTVTYKNANGDVIASYSPVGTRLISPSSGSGYSLLGAITGDHSLPPIENVAEIIVELYKKSSTSNEQNSSVFRYNSITINPSEDTSAPVFENSTPSLTSITSTGFTLNTDIDEPGKVYYVVVGNDATVPTPAEVKAGTSSGGDGAFSSGNATVNTGGFINNFSVTGLIASTPYDVYIVAEDVESTPNLQATVNKIDITTPFSFSAGDGSIVNPYQVATKADLHDVRNYLSASFIQTADIIFDAVDFEIGGPFYNSGEGFIPINSNFRGTYNGQGYGIRDLKINLPNYALNVGLFGYTSTNAIIENVNLINVNIVGKNQVGGLVGNAREGTVIKNSTVTGTVSGDAQNIGGLVGLIDGSGSSITNSYTSTIVSSSNGSVNNIGGLVGNLSSGSSVNSSYSSGTVTATTTNNIGGLIGFKNAAATVTNSYYDTTTAGQNDTGRGVPKTTLEMKTEATFIGFDFTGSACGTDYSWKINSINNTGYPYLCYQYPDITPPAFENATPSVSSITASGLSLETDLDEAGTIYYVIVADGSAAPSTTEIKAGTGDSGSLSIAFGSTAVSSGGFNNSFTITGLSGGTAYDLYVVAEDDEESANLQTSSVKIDVTTLALAVVSTQAVTDILTTTATGNGNIIDLGSTAPTQHGVVWSTSTNPTVAISNRTEEGAVSSTGSFTSEITGLSSDTKYYLRAYATSSVGTTYGDEVVFITSTNQTQENLYSQLDRDDINIYKALTQRFFFQGSQYVINGEPAIIRLTDDFNVPPGGWFIDRIDVLGGYWNGSGGDKGPAESFTVEIYEDNSGLPANTPIFTETVSSYSQSIELSSPANGIFSIPLATGTTLPEGTYWISVQANMDFVNKGNFGWHLSDSPQVGNEMASLVSHVGLATGRTSLTWTSASSVDDPAIVFGSLRASYDLAFSLFGNPCINPTFGGTITESQTVCFRESPNELSSSALPTGHTGTLEYKWQSSTTSVSNGFTDILSSNSANYNIGTLTKTTWFKRLARVDCKSDWSVAAESNVIEIKVREIFMTGAIETSIETICYDGDPGIIGSVTMASGGDENITYKWESSLDGFDTTGTTIIGATSLSYDPPAGLKTTTSYRRYAQDENCNPTFEPSLGTTTVIVEDNIAPTVVVQNRTVELDETGTASITTADINNGSLDNCEIASMTLDITEFDCDALGENEVVLSVTDVNMNVASATATVTVVDLIAPTVVVQNITVELDESGAASVVATDIDNGSLDNCSIASMTLDVTSFDCSSVGDNVVTFTITDVNMNVSTATATVTVMDLIMPTVVAQDITVELDSDGIASIVADDIDNGSTDNCEITSMELDNTTFNCASVGENTVVLTVTDVNGNSAMSTATVTVVDVLAPTVMVQDIMIELDADGVASIVVTDIDNGSGDNCEIESLSLDMTDFDCSSVGENTVTLTVTDIHGNSNTAIAVVTVVDTVMPVVSTTAPFTLTLDENGSASIVVSDIDNGSTDNCGIASMSFDMDSFDCTSVGENTVILTVIDGSGNSATGTTVVTVVDTTAPIVVAQNISIELDDFGNATIDASDINDNSFDACGIASMSLDQTSFSCPTLGDHTVTLTVIDVNGNSASEMAIVTFTSDDIDNDLVADVCDDDMDGDGVDNDIDNCPTTANSDQRDLDRNGIGDICDEGDLEIPKGFSPNSDGVNDEFIILGLHKYPNNSIQIYNRYGNMVYESKAYQNYWDGVGNKKERRLPAAPYFYVLSIDGGSRIVKGWVYINY